MEYFVPAVQDIVALEDFDLAHKIIDKITPYASKDGKSYDILSHLNFIAKRYITAAEWGEKLLATTIDGNTKRATRFNLGKCWNHANYPDKAYKHLSLNSKLYPEDLDSKLDMCVSLYSMNKKEDAYQILKELESNSSIDDKHKDVVRFNLGTHEIRKGNFKLGLEYLSIGRKLRIWGAHTHNFPIPVLEKGFDISGKRVIVIGEGGIGDEIINSRFVNHMTRQGAKVTWASAQGLAEVIQRSLPVESAINYKKFTSDIPDIKSYDFWAPAMDLPLILDVDTNELWSGPYIKARETVEETRTFFVSHESPSIGIRWSGNPLYEQDLHRSIPVKELIDVCRPFGNLWSLQKDEKIAFPNNVVEQSLDSIEDTISLIDSLDFVVTSCTGVAHISAAMGKRTFIFVPIMNYYVWGEEKSTSYWYGDNVTLIRQSEMRSWEKPLEELREHLINSNMK